MGTWGAGIFADDVAVDLRDHYRDLIGEGRATVEATDELLRIWSEELADPDTERVIWLALAATQVRIGRLEDRVRDRALAIIDSGEDLPRWREDPKAARDRDRVLAELRADLSGPQRLPTRVPRPIRSVWPFDPESIVAFRRADGRRSVFRVVGTFGTNGTAGGRVGILEPLDWTGDETPETSTLQSLPTRAAQDWTASSPAPLGVTVLNQRQLDRWECLLPGSGTAGFVLHYLINTKEVDRVLADRYGL